MTIAAAPRGGILSHSDDAVLDSAQATHNNELFADEGLLGAILVSAARAGGGPEVSGWTVSARRNAVSAAANLLAPELRALGISEPDRVVNSALRLRAERIGKRYRLPKPLLRKDGRRPSPSAAEVAALVQVAERDPG